MARSRNIKPGLAANADLAECSIFARYLFALLPTIADREGRLEDRPKQIKGELLRFDNEDVAPLLHELAERRFIIRYQNAAGRWIQITKFWRHQTPHYSEKDSVIMPPSFQEWPAHERTENPGTLPLDGGHDPGLIEPIKGGVQPPDSFNLIPDSLNRIPDSPIPDSRLPDSKGSLVTADATPKPAKAPKAERGTRLPADWVLPKTWGEWATQERPAWSAEQVRELGRSFGDYWTSKSEKATKLDWEKTWRNWVRNQKTAPIVAARNPITGAGMAMLGPAGQSTANAGLAWLAQGTPERQT